MPYVLFFASGASALIYEVVWVRVFANVFGNTVYSASIVTAVFMLGLGIGSYAAGVFADRRYSLAPSEGDGLAPSRVEGRPGSMLHVFASLEFGIGVLGLAISLLLPHLEDVSAAVSSYTRGVDGWYVLSFRSYAARTAIAVALLTPATLLMGATLTVLIRHVVRAVDLTGSPKPRGAERGAGPRIALLYGANTLGAAIGCMLTDFAFVPSYGLRATQTIAIAINLATAAGALAVTSQNPNPKTQIPKHLRIPNPESRLPAEARRAEAGIPAGAAATTLVLTGAAGMGMEILWFRHFSILLGEFRAVFALLLAIVLLGIGAGSLAGAYVQRRLADPARTLIAIQGIFVAATLLGLASANAQAIRDAAGAYRGERPGALTEIWFNARPIVLVAGLPALLMGFAFPLANAMVQRVEASVGRRAGMLYLANTFGAVGGSLATGFLLLPALGIQRSATVLMVAAGLAIIPLVVRLKADATWHESDGRRRAVEGRHVASGFSRTVGASALIAIGALALWIALPSDFILSRALLFPPQRAYTISEGVTELIAVTDGPDSGRVLVTNGHPMSSTVLLSQRYMRAMAHVPLLAIDNPARVLVLCYGVGNTARAATLHPTVAQVDIVDLSRHVLDHSTYFTDVNGDVLHDPLVRVYINDGRHHLQMQPPASYDLITLEPPPIVHAGVAALYTTEFYQRARTRLTPKGFITQWLPAFGVPQSMILSMVRSFVDVFPNAVLLSGAASNLLLIGTREAPNEIDPDRLAAALRKAPAVQMDLQRLDLGTPREIAGMFVAASKTLVKATQQAAPVTDDHPIQEYGRKSLLEYDERMPSSLVDVAAVADWCPACFEGGRPARAVEGLDTYLALLNLAYTAPPAQTAPAGAGPRPIAGSGYLGAVIPESAQLDAMLKGAFIETYQRGTDLLAARLFPDAIDQFRAALTWNPGSVEAHNNLGIALASLGRMDEAVDQFKQALAIEPAFEDARRNLAMATRR